MSKKKIKKFIKISIFGSIVLSFMISEGYKDYALNYDNPFDKNKIKLSDEDIEKELIEVLKEIPNDIPDEHLSCYIQNHLSEKDKKNLLLLRGIVKNNKLDEETKNYLFNFITYYDSNPDLNYERVYRQNRSLKITDLSWFYDKVYEFERKEAEKNNESYEYVAGTHNSMNNKVTLYSSNNKAEVTKHECLHSLNLFEKTWLNEGYVSIINYEFFDASSAYRKEMSTIYALCELIGVENIRKAANVEYGEELYIKQALIDRGVKAEEYDAFSCLMEEYLYDKRQSRNTEEESNQIMKQKNAEIINYLISFYNTVYDTPSTISAFYCKLLEKVDDFSVYEEELDYDKNKICYFLSSDYQTKYQLVDEDITMSLELFLEKEESSIVDYYYIGYPNTNEAIYRIFYRDGDCERFSITYTQKNFDFIKETAQTSITNEDRKMKPKGYIKK